MLDNKIFIFMTVTNVGIKLHIAIYFSFMVEVTYVRVIILIFGSQSEEGMVGTYFDSVFVLMIEYSYNNQQP